MAKKIIFIEDEPTIQKAMAEILIQERFEILGALDGKKGLELIKKEKPDLVLLDLILPEEDGFQVFKEIKESKELKNIPVIILTNLKGESVVKKAMNLGAAAYLVKADYELEDVVGIIKRTLK